MNSPGEVDPAPEEQTSAELETNTEVGIAKIEGKSGTQTLKSEERETEAAISNHDNTTEVAKSPVRESEMDPSLISVEKTPSKYQQKKAKKQVCLYVQCAHQHVC